jgi:hypothetical protein
MFKFKLRLTQAIKIHHHQQEWNHQVLKLIKKKVKFMVTIMDGALIKGGQGGEAQEDAPQVEDDDDEPIQHQSQAPHPRVHQMVQQDHLVDNILGSIQRGVTTRSRLSKFCAFYSFVSSLEPLSVEQALEDPDWIIAMEEELNNFKRNEVWKLVPRPKKNVIGTK